MIGSSRAFDARTAVAMLEQVQLEGESLEAVVAALVPRRLDVRQVLFHQGDDASSLYVVQEGSLKLTRTSSGGRTTILAVLGAGEVLGEMSLLDRQPRTATAVALTPVTILELDQSRFDALITEHPAVIALLLRHLGQRLRRSNDVVADLVFADVPARVARLILRLAQQFGVDDGAGNVMVEHGLSQEELAQLVGSARETVNKVLGSFASHGWLDVRRRAIVMKNPQPLRELVL